MVLRVETVEGSFDSNRNMGTGRNCPYTVPGSVAAAVPQNKTSVGLSGQIQLKPSLWRIAGVGSGRLFRCVSRSGTVWGEGITEKVVRHVVKEFAAKLGVPKLAPHDLRRSCARLCHAAGGELEQIQFLLGHVSVQTTEKYLGCKQRLRGAVNDRIGIEPAQ